MASDVLYKHPNDEILYAVDFTDDLPGDTTVSSSSSVTAVDSDNASATSTVIGTASQSGMEARAVLQAGTDGEDYTITWTGRGTTTSRDATKIIEMRVRAKRLGSV